MAKIKIVGRATLVYVSSKVADKIAEMKIGNMFEPSHLVDLGGEGFIELGQIKQIVPDDPTALAEVEQNEQRTKERMDAIKDWNEYVKRCRSEGVEQKARRMVSSWCLLAYISKGNVPERDNMNQLVIPKDINDDLMLRLIDYFDRNPNEWTCQRKEYIDLIPKGEKKMNPLFANIIK